MFADGRCRTRRGCGGARDGEGRASAHGGGDIRGHPVPGDDQITAAWLDFPRTGPVDGYAFEVSGWVVSKAPVAEVEFVHELTVVASCELTVPRPDVASMYGSSSPVGFWKAIGTVGLAPDFTMEVRVVFGNGRRHVIAEIRGTQQLTSTFTPSMQPIMVTSPGRSGSTLLMRMLAEHPDIIVEERFPYETYVCSYWMHFLQVLATPMDTSPLGSHEFWMDLKRLSPFPYFFIDPHTGPIPPEQATLDRWYASDQVEEFARVAQAAVESFYREYAGARNRTTPAFFAEKIVPAGHIRWIMRAALPAGAGDIPRSGSQGHPGLRTGVPYEEYGSAQLRSSRLERMNNSSSASARAYCQWQNCGNADHEYGALVRYEDLVRSPTEQIRAMLDALELDSSANIVDSMVKAGKETTADVNSHRTSPDVASSIGRWKRDLEPRLQKFCDEAFDGVLDELGGSSW